MSDRDEQGSGRWPRPDRSERLAAALRANLKRRKAQARGRAEPSKAMDRDKVQPSHRNSESKDR
jgi:hypothetical protein